MAIRSTVLGLLTLLLLPLPAASQVGSPPMLGDQTLQPGDVVKLDIWREPDFSGEYTVNEGGRVTLPRLGEILVTEFTAIELESELLTRYREFLRNPSITITILKRIRIIGSVREPNLYPVDATISIADALALAGGVTPDGRQDRIELRRAGQTVVAELDANRLLVDTPLRSGDELFVPQRSWFSRNTNVIAAGIGAVVTLIVAVSR